MFPFFKSRIILLPLLILTLGMEGCGSAQTSNNKFLFEEDPPFKIKEAYCQKWVAGIKDGGTGTNVHIVFSEIKPGVNIHDLYYGEQVLEIKKSLKNPNEYISRIQDSRKDVIMDIDPIQESKNTPPAKVPFDLSENEAVLGYLFRGKTSYYKIPLLSEKQSIAYPQQRPKQ